MEPDRFDELIKGSAQSYHPPGDVPREAMWALVAAELARPPANPSITPRSESTRRTWRRAWWVAGASLAASVLLATGVWLNLPTEAQSPDPIQTASDPLLAAASEHLVRVDSLLSEYQSNHLGGDFQNDARELLARTRILLSTNQIADARVSQLLSDVELLLAQVARLSGDDPIERQIIDASLVDTAIIARLKQIEPELRTL